MLKGFGVELVAGNLALGEPDFTIHVKDPISEQFMEDRLESRAFHIVGEIGTEEVVEIRRISRANYMREAQKEVYLDSEGW